MDLGNGIVVSSSLSENEVQGVKGVERADKGNGYSQYVPPVVKICGKNVRVSLHFLNGKIEYVFFDLIDPALYGSGWNDFSEEKEKLRARDTEVWLKVLGYSVDQYSWGTIWAGFDPKSGNGHGGVRFD